MGQLRLLLQVAFRNLFSSKINLLIGGIIFFGTLLVVVGGALMDSMDSAMSRSIIGSVAGHIQVYSDDSKDPLALYGSMSGEPDLAALDDFSQLRPFLEKHPNVKTVVPLGTSGAIVTSGNTVDLTLSNLRALYKKRDDAGETPELRESIDSVKGHVRQMVNLMADQTAKSEQELGGAQKDPAEVEALARARTDAFWDAFEEAPYSALELLENRIAPQIPDGDMLELRYAGTDLDAFQRTFDRMEIVDGQPVPTGQRGMLLSKFFYEEFLKLKSALRLDHIKQARELNQKTIATDPDLQRWVKENQTQTREIIFQLDPVKTRKMVERLQKLLGSQEPALDKLLTQFFTTDDANFDTRYAQFYSELAPLLELYRLRMGDVLTITAFTRTGYMQSANVKVYGTYQFKGLEKSAMAGALSLMDLMSFRDLYGYLTADKKAELAEIQKQSGVSALSRDEAEEALFGEASDNELVAEATSTDVDDQAAFTGDQGALTRENLLQRVYTQQEIEQGVALSAAVMLKDPELLEQTMVELRQAAKDAGLKLRVVSWQEAAGIIGQFVLLGKLVLYFAVFIIFVVALVIINNAMMMATMQRVREVGTMRAIGAQRSFILGMVLVETLVLGLVFGSAGSLVGSGIMALLNNAGIPAGNEALYFFFSGPRLFPTLSASNLVAAFVIVLGVSAISTLYPAFLATRVSPLQAMQTDE
ncbi:cell division protein FtsX [Myxococcus xanthus]|uniref:Cell division protein FtsX n=1 Tax=Myxococcus xanthus TaxID=34 RepID=A0AAE6KRV9_MYXXA|nr:FtsX-like permease family protein [Myxococcus xanthus]QDE67581.1 cell division protein FtsX [Myxococcus xanthus]QDE74858.1 cell division protein FtsX [Myxococcus xanthus]QDF03912.1 cell division protein FtsX [Myxococcus xanthus]